MRVVCSLIAALLVLTCLLAFITAPGTWLVHVAFAGFIGVFLAMVVGFFRAPILISSLFICFSVYLASRAHSDATQATASMIALLILCGVPAFVLFILGCCALWKISENARRHEIATARASARRYAGISISGGKSAESDPLFRPFCKTLRTFRFRYAGCPITDDMAQMPKWPSASRFSLVLFNSQTLNKTLWTDKARLASFREWLKPRTYKCVAATSDGTLVPLLNANIGYIDTKQIGVFRTVLFLANAFTDRLRERYYEHLRRAALISAVLSVVSILAIVTESLSENGIDNPELLVLPMWILLAGYWTFLWQKVCTQHLLTYLTFGPLGVLLLFVGIAAVPENITFSLTSLSFAVDVRRICFAWYVEESAFGGPTKRLPRPTELRRVNPNGTSIRPMSP